MRLLLSASASLEGPVADLAIECDDLTTVGDVARRLAELVAPELLTATTPGRHLGLVDPSGTTVLRDAEPAPPPTLYLGERALDPGVRVDESPLRHGAHVGVGLVLPDLHGERDGVVEVRTTSGSGAGHIDRLGPGRHPVGRAAHNAVVVDDDAVPDVALTLEVAVDGAVTIHPGDALSGAAPPGVAPPARSHPLESPIIIPTEHAPAVKVKRGFKHQIAELERLKHPHYTVDPEADRPLVHLDRVAVHGPTPWPPGLPLVLGEVTLQAAPTASPDASMSPSPGGLTLDYNRPPRLLPPPRTTEFRLPTEPKAPDKQPIPWPMAMTPMVMGVSLFLVTGRPLSLLIAVLSPTALIANYFLGRKGRRGRFKEDMRSYIDRTQKVEKAAYAALVAERSGRRRDLPDPASVLLFATGPRSRLWERRRTDPDWMLARIGTADIPSEVTVTDPALEDFEKNLHWTAPDVPVEVPLDEVGVTGIVGAHEQVHQLASWVVGQAATMHSPADLQVVVLADPAGADVWSWVRWLPHLRRDVSSEVIAGVGSDDETTNRRVAELMGLLENRKAAAQDRGNSFMSKRTQAFPPVLVVLDGARRIRLLPGLVTLLREGPAHGILFVCLDSDERALPEECHAVVRMGPVHTTVAITGAPDVDGVRPDLVPAAWCERLGRALAPVKDVSSEDLASSLPSSSRLLEVLRMDPVTSEAVEGIWSAGGRSTRAVIGEGLDGPFSVDIRADGPHGLVAGTTGSGKSELLQTLIASLAVANRPDEMTFVLVDYKGGAAFKDCNHLPHTVGMVTDLDGHLTTRALESLTAELHRREHQLAGADAKDIEDYLAARTEGDAPMPRLMIVIDEFAAMVAELPDFVKGLVDIARRGRSLGVHLILATQRPAGVVSAEIKSNTNLRIALRVTDKNDSQDVIESGEAAEIGKSSPGRAYARLGHSSLVAFQSSRVGGRPATPGAAVVVEARPLAWQTIGRPAPGGGAEEEDDVSTPTDLASLVTAVQQAAESSGVAPPPPPWLPALDDVVTLDEVLADPKAVVGEGARIRLPFGVVDVPSEQRRDIAVFDVGRGSHLSVVGAARSGRSTVLRAIAGVIGREVSPADVHIYGVDCGNNALLPLMGLPHVGAVVSRDQPERLSSLTSRIRAEIGRRQQLLAEQGFADLSEQRAARTGADRIPYLVVLFDRWEGFMQAYENFDSGRLVDQWMQIFQEGAGVGVKVVLASDRSALVGRVSTLFEDKLMLRMNEATDFTSVGMMAKEVPDHMPPGRAFRSENTRETHVALLTEDPAGTAQVAAIRDLAEESTARFADVPRKQRPFRVDPLPGSISLTDALALGDGDVPVTEVPIAVGGDTLALRSFDAFEHGPGLLVLGPRRAGRSTALLTMVVPLLRGGWRIGVMTPRRSPLRDLDGVDGVTTIPTDIPKDETAAAFAALAPSPDGPPTALVIDDVELLGVDGYLVDAVVNHLGTLRDSGSVVIAAGTTDDLGSSYRGPVASLKKSRSGLLMSPGVPGDGDHFGIKVARSMTGGMPPGRGLYVAGGQWQLVQVPETTVADVARSGGGDEPGS